MRSTARSIAPPDSTDSTESTDSPLRPVKPSWRGASHRAAFLAAPLPVLALMAVAAGRGTVVVASCLIYSITFVALFGVSSSYHLCKGPPATVLRWKRADHATIFLMIAGTYTPLSAIGVGGEVGAQMLVLIWAGAILGVLRATLWHKAPRGISAALYLALGWLLAWYMSEVRVALGDPMLALMLTGGAFYTIGAVIYALKRPDPLPAEFGYHEIFHALVILAAACHFVFVIVLVSGA
jgi:hemolysin III